MNEVYTDLEDDVKKQKSIDYKSISRGDIEKAIGAAFYNKPSVSYNGLKNKMNYLQEYKGIWWGYNSELDRWVLSDKEDTHSSMLMNFGGDKLITECFHIFTQWMLGNTPFDY